MLQNVASHLGLHCLPMSHKKDARLKWVKILYFYVIVIDQIKYCLNQARLAAGSIKILE